MVELLQKFENLGAVMCIKICLSMSVFHDEYLPARDHYEQLTDHYKQFIEILQLELIKNNCQNLLEKVSLECPNLTPFI